MTPAGLVPPTLGLSEIWASRFDQMSVGAAVALILGGVVLQAVLPRVRMNAEEKAKDRILTESENRHRIQFYRCCAAVMTLAGVTVLVLVVVDLAR